MKSLIIIILCFLINQNLSCNYFDDDVDSICSCKINKTDSRNESDEAILIVEEPAKCPNGDLNDFVNFVQDCITKPYADSSKNKDKVVLRFHVDIDGSLTDIKILRCNNSILAKEAIACINKSPKWIPAKQRGKNVKQLIIIPIRYK